MCVCYADLVCGLSGSVGQLLGSGSFLEKQKTKQGDEEYGRDEGVDHESQGKVQALSFCQQLIQLWLRSQLKQQTLAK